MRHVCAECGKHFGKQESAQQHVRDAHPGQDVKIDAGAGASRLLREIRHAAGLLAAALQDDPAKQEWRHYARAFIAKHQNG